MTGLRYTTLKGRANDVLDFTSLTEEEFALLVEPFEQAFVARMRDWCLDGKPRTKRAYSTYENCPLPSPEDRLLFILSYLKSNALQIFHGHLFAMRQNKANQWIHTLLPVLRATLVALGDAPSRNLEHLACRLGLSHETFEAGLPAAGAGEELPTPEAANQAPPAPPPLFAMMAPNDPSLAPKMRQNRKAAIAARNGDTR